MSNFHHGDPWFDCAHHEQSHLRGAIKNAGVGLKNQHIRHILDHQPKLNWFEVLSDNFMADGGFEVEKVKELANLYPCTLHCVGASIGSSDQLDFKYLEKIKKLAKELNVAWISEHLCWTSIDHQHLNELLPLPYTEKTIKHVAQRIKTIQDFFEQKILIENVSSYVAYNISQMSESEFVSHVAKEADCNLLLDINNIYVSSANHQLDPYAYLDNIPQNLVKEIHLAGFEKHQDLIIDTHSQAVDHEVWKLYQYFVDKYGPRPTLIEWDNNVPEFEVLLAEARKADRILFSYKPKKNI